MRYLCLLSVLLTGCSHHAEHFDSEPGKGVVARISKADQLVDQGILPYTPDCDDKNYVEWADSDELAKVWIPNLKSYIDTPLKDVEGDDQWED